MELALDESAGASDRVGLWPELLDIYEDQRGDHLIPEERSILPAMAAIALLHTLAHAGYMAEPAMVVREEAAFLRTATRLLDA